MIKNGHILLFLPRFKSVKDCSMLDIYSYCMSQVSLAALHLKNVASVDHKSCYHMLKGGKKSSLLHCSIEDLCGVRDNNASVC